MYCSKAFVNASFLHAHIARRHQQLSQLAVQPSRDAVPVTRPLHVEAVPVTKTTPLPAASKTHAADAEFARELEEIRERLRITESQLVDERNSRYELLKKVLTLMADCKNAAQWLRLLN